MNTPPTHDVYVRMTVRKTVTGRLTPQKKHKAVKAIRRVLAHAAHGYTVVSAEVATVTERRLGA
jgi:predicted RNA-binding protein associated with RNAse of E/G family